MRCTENGLGQEIGQGRWGCTALLRYGDLDTSTNCSTPPTPMTRLLRSGTRIRQIESTRARRARARAAASRRAQLRRLGRGNPTVDNRARAGDNVHPPLPACISSCDSTLPVSGCGYMGGISPLPPRFSGRCHNPQQTSSGSSNVAHDPHVLDTHTGIPSARDPRALLASKFCLSGLAVWQGQMSTKLHVASFQSCKPTALRTLSLQLVLTFAVSHVVVVQRSHRRVWTH